MHGRKIHGRKVQKIVQYYAPQYITAKVNPKPDRRKMLWLLLEAGFALVVLIVIVWWTWPKKPRDGDRDR